MNLSTTAAPAPSELVLDESLSVLRAAGLLITTQQFGDEIYSFVLLTTEGVRSLGVVAGRSNGRILKSEINSDDFVKIAYLFVEPDTESLKFKADAVLKDIDKWGISDSTKDMLQRIYKCRHTDILVSVPNKGVEDILGLLLTQVESGARRIGLCDDAMIAQIYAQHRPLLAENQVPFLYYIPCHSIPPKKAKGESVIAEGESVPKVIRKTAMVSVSELSGMRVSVYGNGGNSGLGMAGPNIGILLVIREQ